MVAAAVVGSAVVGGVVSANAADKAADAQENASNAANATSNAQYQQTREDQAPWREAGERALDQLSSGTASGGQFDRDFTLADFTKDPGYEFRLGEGQRGLDASAAARGGVLSGAALKASSRYNQDYASGEYQNAYNRFNANQSARFNRLSSLAGTGQTATNQVAAAGAQNAQTVSNNQLGVGNAQASSYVGQGNAISGVAQTLGNFALQRQYMNASPMSGGGVLSNTAPYQSYSGDYNNLGYQ